MNRTLLARRAWLAVSIAVLITYNTWVFLVPVNGHPKIINGYLSELSASDQPGNLFFRGGDLITSLLMLVVGLAATRSWPRHIRGSQLVAGHRAASRWWWVAAAALILFAVSTLLDSFFSMDCSPTLSEVCERMEDAGQLSLIHYAHTYTSVGAETGIVTSLLAGCLAVHSKLTPRTDRHFPPRFLLGLGGIEVAALLVMMGMLVAGAPGLGYPQAVMVATASVWFSLAARSLAHNPTPDEPVETPNDLQDNEGIHRQAEDS